MKFKLEFNGKEMTADMSGLAERANGSCLLRYGDTVVLATVVMSQREAQAQGFFPLSVEYLERYYAACLLYTSPSPRDLSTSRMPSSA